MAQGAKIRTKTHGLNPNFCCQIQTGTGHSRNWHGPDSNLAHWTRSLAWAKKQGFRVIIGKFTVNIEKTIYAKLRLATRKF